MAEPEDTSSATSRKEPDDERAIVRAEIRAIDIAAEEMAPAELRELAAELRDLIRAGLARPPKGADPAAYYAKSIERLERMRRAAYSLQTEFELVPDRVLSALGHMRSYVKQTGKSFERSDVKLLREFAASRHHAEALRRFTDDDILRIMRADNFAQVAAAVLGERGYPMSDKNVGRILKK